MIITQPPSYVLRLSINFQAYSNLFNIVNYSLT
ncbi:hypothetical protein EMIT0194P_110179 [Pseudomonas serbica]